MKISYFLKTGKENATPGKKLCLAFGITYRELTQAIEKERREGQPICAATGGDSRGYFIAANKQEMRAYCDSIYKRCGELFKTRRACLKTLENLPDGDAPDTVKN